jgi:hypothetical protein
MEARVVVSFDLPCAVPATYLLVSFDGGPQLTYCCDMTGEYIFVSFKYGNMTIVLYQPYMYISILRSSVSKVMKLA